MTKYIAKPRKKDMDFSLESLIECEYTLLGLCLHPYIILRIFNKENNKIPDSLKNCDGIKKPKKCPKEFLKNKMIKYNANPQSRVRESP